jgi:hypothetical protein
MTTLDGLDLEDRLRSGLQAAAEALPPQPERATAAATPAVPVGAGRAARSWLSMPLLRRRWVRTAVAAAATFAAVAGTAVVLTRDSDGDGQGHGRGDVATESSEPPSSTTSTAPPHEARLTNGQVPGQATADREGVAIHTYGPDGTETGTVELGMTNVQAAASDLDGGYVVCGMAQQTPEEVAAAEAQLSEIEEDARAAGRLGPDGSALDIRDGAVVTPSWVDRLVWYPAGGEPVSLDGPGGGCMSNSVQVVDSDEGPLALVGGIGGLVLGGPQTGQPYLDAIVLATGEHRELPVPDLGGLPGQWSVSTGLLLTYVEGAGLQLFDLDDQKRIPTAAIDPGDISELALSHDGKTAAVMRGSIEGPDEVIVYDLASGAEIFRKSFGMSIEGDEMSYDGRTLAVGSYYPDRVPLTVIDMATHAEHTIHANGVVL